MCCLLCELCSMVPIECKHSRQGDGGSWVSGASQLIYQPGALQINPAVDMFLAL